MIYFFVPYLTKMTNALARQHHRVYTTEKNLVYRLVGEQLAKDRIKVPPLPYSKAICILIRHSSSEPDADGVISGFKYVIDSLTHYKIIQNDKITMLEIIPKWVKCKRENQGVSVALIPLE